MKTLFLSRPLRLQVGELRTEQVAKWYSVCTVFTARSTHCKAWYCCRNFSTILPRFREIAGFLRRATPPLFHPNFWGVPLGLDC